MHALNLNSNTLYLLTLFSITHTYWYPFFINDKKGEKIEKTQKNKLTQEKTTFNIIETHNENIYKNLLNFIEFSQNNIKKKKKLKNLSTGDSFRSRTKFRVIDDHHR